MTVITVSQVNTYIKSLIDESTPLKNIFIVGEISNFVHYFRSGHMYFTLKDEKSQIKAVMFSSYASRLKFAPEDGMRVICRGRVSVYEKDGLYQLYVEDIQPDGVGALNVAFEQLKNKLAGEGLFDDAHKKSLPKYPQKIGIATSNIGAAVEDIKNILKRRYPLCEVIIAPTIVQGEQAPEDIVKSLKLLDSMDVDIIIVGRGGGSIEDLWAFNTEIVARAVFLCEKPVISAVGHETDFTICDFVADLRAPTPSAAAELAVPDMSVLFNDLNNISYTLSLFVKNKLENEYQKLDSFSKNFISDDKVKYINNLNDNLDLIKNKMICSISNCIDKNFEHLAKNAGKLNALSPLAVLERGYSVSKQNDKIIKTIKQINDNEQIEIVLVDGTVICSIDEVINND